MLTGFYCPDASIPLTVVTGKNTAPHAFQTILSWSIVWCMSDGLNSTHFSHSVSTKELTSEEILKCLSEDFSTEDGSPMSQNDVAFLKRMKESITMTDGFYTMP